MLFDHLGIRRSLIALAVAPLLLLLSLSWIAVDLALDRAADANERELAVERLVTLARVRNVMLAEIALYDIWVAEAASDQSAFSGPQSTMLQESLRRDVDLAIEISREARLTPETHATIDEMYSDLSEIRSWRDTDQASIGPVLADLADRVSDFRDGRSTDMLAVNGASASVLLRFSDFADALTIEATTGTGALAVGVLEDASRLRFELLVAITDDRRLTLERDLDDRSGDIREFMESSVFADLRNRVRALPSEGTPEPVSPLDGLGLATRAAAETQFLSDYILEVGDDITAEALADRRDARIDLFVTVAVVIFVLTATTTLGIHLGRRLVRRVSNLSEVARRVSAGELDLPPIDDRGTDGIALLAGSMDEMIGTLATVQSQLAALAEGHDDDEVFNTQVPGSIGANLRLTVNRLRAHTERLRELADTDELTGLPNRRAFAREVSALPKLPTIAVVDLDGFKEVNDRLGHAVGDEVLVAIGKRMRAAVRPDDLVARLGGDEFLVAVSDDAAAAEIAERISRIVADPIRTSQGTVGLGASVGVAAPHDGATVDDILHEADAAMYGNKYARRGATRSTIENVFGTQDPVPQPADFEP